MTRIPALERSLLAAAARLEAPEPDSGQVASPTRRPFGRRLPARSLLLAALLLVAVTGTALAGTLLVLRGSVIPGPASRDVPLEQTPVPSTAKVAPERASDPGSGPDWALRVARSRTGLICSTVGQVSRGEFGLVGLDGRFRSFAVGIVDGCGLIRENAASLIGARVFDAPKAADVRTVVNGVGGPQLRRVTVQAAGRTRSIPVGKGGVFVAAFRGYPEDLGIRVGLRFADGHVENHPFGAGREVVPDPVGGHAWKVQQIATAPAPPAGCHGKELRLPRCRPDAHAPIQTCTMIRPARELTFSSSATVCGYFRTRKSKRAGYFFAVRRQTPTRRKIPRTPFGAVWHGPPRTTVFGAAGDDVRRIDVEGPKGTVRAAIQTNGSFLVMYGPKVKAEQLTVRVTMRDGHVNIHHGDTNLVSPRVFG